MSARWEAELHLALRRRGGRTVLAARAHRGPLLVQRPFHPEGEVCHLYLLHPPAGLVSGDELRLHVDASEGAHAMLTTPGATRFYRARDGGADARLLQEIRIADATVEWLPQESLCFDGTRARTTTRVELGRGARFIGWEVLCLGRPAAGEAFATGRVRQDFELWHEGRPLLLDRLRLDPEEATRAPWGFAGHAALGTLMAWPATPAQLDAVRALDATGALACTIVDGAMLVRTLAAQGATVRARLHRCWQALRPLMLDRPAVAPRIWAT